MADSILRLRVESQEYDAKIKRAAEGIQRYAEGCRKAGGTLEHLDDGVEQFVKELGKMETTSSSARGKINEMTKAFTDLSVEYKHLTDQEKEAPFGKALSISLDQMKGRIMEAKEELNAINNSLGGKQSGGGLFGGGKLDGMLQVFGGNLMTKAAGWAASFATELGDCVKQGIELAKQGEGVRLAFERLNQPGLLDNLNESTHGTVSNLELMKAAIKFDNFKLPLEDLGTYLAFAQQKAKDTGESIDYLVTSIVNGLGRQSVQILDNLGISAGEIRKRMAEGGDMVKVVADIIRDEMAKAGDYVETAADRAAQADKRLTDAMEDLGRTFQPLSDAGASLWNDLKVGALDLLNNAVRPLIDALTEAGRIRAQYASQGGDSRVNRQLGRLENIHSLQYRRNTYNAQLSNYDSKIGSYEQYLSDYKKWQSDKTSIGAYDRMQAFQKQTGLSMYSDVKEQLEVFKKMRAEYVMGAKNIIADNPAPSPTSPTSTTKTNGGSKNSTYAPDSIAAQQALVQQLTKQWNEAGSEVRNSYLQPLIEAEAKLKTMKDQQALQKEQAQGKLLGGDVQTTELGNVVSGFDKIGEGLDTLPEHLSPLQQLNAELAKLKQNLELSPNTEAYQAGLQAIADKEKEIAQFKGMDDLTNGAKGTSKSFSQAASAIGQVGSALNSIEDPTAKVMATVAQAIATIAMAYSEALAKDKTNKSNIWYFIATAGAAMASMSTTIASIHSATGYAEGGMIKGNSYSGDNLMAMGPDGGLIGLNAGEIVLNKAQSANLATSLQQGGGGTTRIVGVLKGEDIVLMADRWGMRTGRGELLFGKNL